MSSWMEQQECIDHIVIIQYIGINIQFPDPSLSGIMIRTLGVFESKGKHTGRNISSLLENTLTSYNIKMEQVLAVVC